MIETPQQAWDRSARFHKRKLAESLRKVGEEMPVYAHFADDVDKFPTCGYLPPGFVASNGDKAE